MRIMYFPDNMYNVYQMVTVSHANLYYFSDDDTDEPGSGNGGENPYGGMLA